MALEPLGRRPEVLRTYQVMERNNLYREKVQLGQVIEHIDKLTTAIAVSYTHLRAHET